MPIRIEKNDHVTTVILDRPQVRNAVDGPTAQEIAQAFREFDADDDAYVGVFCGAGGHFCAGADLKAFSNPQEARHNRLDPQGDAPMGPSRMRLSKPVIAAISGYAVAGGLELALWCDLRVMEETATLGIFCRRFGVPLIDGGTIRLPRLIGMSRALDLILTGRPVGAQEALEFGLVNRVVPDGRAKAEAQALAAQIAAFPQACMRSDRLSAYEQWDLSWDEAIKNEFERGVRVITSGETLSGAQRFASGEGKHGAF
ncbi:MAG: crotonase/enoyl-CoA hydratase family protein [Thermodesulfobacteriota bacterium]